MQVRAAGVLSLVIPSNPDQILVAERIRNLGIGSYMKNPKGFPVSKEPLRNVGIEKIRDEVERIIGDRECKARCERLKGVVKEYGKRKGFVWMMENVDLD